MRPVILLGNGIRSYPDTVDFLCSLGIPVLTTWMGADLVPESSPVFCGRPGIYGQRAANIIQQKATHLFVYGARLDEGQVAYRLDRFAQRAGKYVFVFDVDQAEMDKLPDEWITTRHLAAMDAYLPAQADPAWLAWCKALYARFRPELDGREDPAYVDPFAFIADLSSYARANDIIVAGAGKAGETLMQAFKVKAGQRLLTLSTNGAMGYDIPLAIGAALGAGRRVLCVTGDGGFMLNMQELEVARRLPIQFFIYSNNGYGSIRAMQQARFDGRIVGADPASGFTIPHLAEVADCFGMSYQCIETLERPYKFQAQIVELNVDPDYVQVPRVATALVDGKWQQDDMADMTPRLPEDELRRIMEWEG